MNTRILGILRPLALSLAAIAMLTLSQGVARADEVTVTGSSSGFVTGVPQLQFTGNANFTATTALGTGAFSGTNSFGTFLLNTSSTQSVSGTFTLNLTFTVPSGIAGGQGTTYTATIQGSVSPNINTGGVNVTFNSPTQTFTFNDGVNVGSFTITVDSLHVQSGQSANLEAGLSGSQVPIPEPATLFLLGTGLSGIAAAARKRRKAAKRDTEA
jgi:hypothetical protein